MGSHGTARIALTVAAALLVGGCAPRSQSTSPAPAQPATLVRPRSTATLAVEEPRPGAAVSGAALHVRLALTGGTITPETSTHLTPDRGHIHLSVDGKVVSMAYGLMQDVPITPGDHLLQAEFVAVDHFPFNPRVIQTITFTAR